MNRNALLKLYRNLFLKGLSSKIAVNELNSLKKKALEIDDQVMAAFLEAGILREQNDNTKALEVIEQALTFEPDFLSGILSRGSILASLERYEEAIVHYDKIISRTKDNDNPEEKDLLARALVDKGFALGEQGVGWEAIKVYDDVVRRFGEAEEEALKEAVANALVNKDLTLDCRRKLDKQ